LQVVVVGTLAHDSTPTQPFTWTNGSTSPVTGPTLNGGGAIPLTASRILATVTASYTNDANVNPVPGPTQTHGLLFFLDDTWNPSKLYSDDQFPGTPCAGSGGYAACLDIAPMLPRN
jgi:hypothetical protein